MAAWGRWLVEKKDNQKKTGRGNSLTVVKGQKRVRGSIVCFQISSDLLGAFCNTAVVGEHCQKRVIESGLCPLLWRTDPKLCIQLWGATSGPFSSADLSPHCSQAVACFHLFFSAALQVHFNQFIVVIFMLLISFFFYQYVTISFYYYTISLIIVLTRLV